MVRSGATQNCSGSGFRSRASWVRRPRRRGKSFQSFRGAGTVIARSASDEAIHSVLRRYKLDCFATLAMTGQLDMVVIHHDPVRGRPRLAGEDEACVELPRL